MFKKAFLIFTAICFSLCAFIACDNGVAFVNDLKEDTSSGSSGGEGSGGAALIPIFVVADAQNKVEGQDDPILTYTINPLPLPSGVDLTGSLVREKAGTPEGENVGNYAITQGTLKLTGEKAGNYSLVFSGATLTIHDKDVITIIAKDQGKFQGDPDPEFTYASGAFVVYPSVESLALRVPPLYVTGTLSRDEGETPGTYAIKQGGVHLEGEEASEYNINYIGANFVISPPGVIEVTAKNMVKTFGEDDPDFQLTCNIMPAGFKLGGVPFISSSEDPSAAHSEKAGTYPIQKGTLKILVAATDEEATQYSVSFTAGRILTINKKNVNVTAEDKAKVMNQAVSPALTYTDDLGLNHAVAFDGALALDPAKPDPPNEVEADYTIVRNSLVLSDNYVDGGNHSKGTYNDNYNMIFHEGTYKVTDRIPITVQAVASSKDFGEADPTFNSNYYIYYPPVPAITITGNLHRTNADKEVCGTYYLIDRDNPGDPSDLTINLNGEPDIYKINFVQAPFKINKAVVNVTAADDLEKYYLDDTPALTYDAGVLESKKANAFVGELSWADNEEKFKAEIATNGSKPFDISQGSLKLSENYVDGDVNKGKYKENYSIDFTSGHITVKKPAAKEIAGSVLKAKIKALHAANTVRRFSRSYELDYDNLPAGGEYITSGGDHNIYLWVDGEDVFYAYTHSDLGVVKVTGAFAKDADPEHEGSPDNTEGLFNGCSKFESIDISGLRLAPSFTNLAYTFANCLTLRSVNISNIDTSKVTDMSYMFYKAGYNDFPSYETGVTKESVANNTHDLVITGMDFDTTSAINMRAMFMNCSAVNLNGLNIANWNVKSVQDMAFMFAGHYVKKGKDNYYWYNKISNLDLSNWETDALLYIESMFNFANRITEVNMSKFNFSKVADFDRLFDRAEALAHLTFPSHTMLTAASNFLYLFNHCLAFKRENFAEVVATWDFTGNTGGAVALFATTSCSGTENTPSNRLISNEMNRTADDTARNFGKRKQYTTYPNAAQLTLYIGGTGVSNPNQLLTTQVLDGVDP